MLIADEQCQYNTMSIESDRESRQRPWRRKCRPDIAISSASFAINQMILDKTGHGNKKTTQLATKHLLEQKIWIYQYKKSFLILKYFSTTTAARATWCNRKCTTHGRQRNSTLNLTQTKAYIHTIATYYKAEKVFHLLHLLRLYEQENFMTTNN